MDLTSRIPSPKDSHIHMHTDHLLGVTEAQADCFAGNSVHPLYSWFSFVYTYLHTYVDICIP